MHQPNLAIIDGLPDQLAEIDTTVLTDAIRNVGKGTAIIALGHDAAALSLICDQTLELTAGIVIGDHAPDLPRWQSPFGGPLPLTPVNA